MSNAFRDVTMDTIINLGQFLFQILHAQKQKVPPNIHTPFHKFFVFYSENLVTIKVNYNLLIVS